MHNPEITVLSNNNLELIFDKKNGALVGITSKLTGWEILNRPNLGLSFRLMVPLPEKRNNAVYGEKQVLTDLDVQEDSVTFIWESLISEYGGILDIRITLEVRIVGDKAVYSMGIDNKSPYTVENVYCPYLGDVQHPENAKWFKSFLSDYATAVEWPIWPKYENLSAYHGSDYPTQYSENSAASGSPMTPFILLRSEEMGLYIGINEESPELVAWNTELRPGYDSSIDSHVPDLAEISGLSVATRFAAVHIPYILSGEKKQLPSISLQTFEGGWQNGVDIYKKWREPRTKKPAIPRWVENPHSWLQLHINSPEDELRIRFKDLPEIAEECVRNGVKAIQLVGWAEGGQDQGNPSHNPDLRLGSVQELREAIEVIKKMGVKIILFAKFTWADRSTDRFRKELIEYSIKDPYGDYYHYPGYRYQSGTQLLDINTKRLIPMCFLSEEWLRVCDDEFRKIVELDADGILYDECQHHSPALLCFDESHGHRYGAPVYANDRKLIENFSKLTVDKKDFLYCGEACYDWEFDVYHLSYFRSWSKNHIPLSRYMLPFVPMMTAVNGFNDRNMVNQCLMYRYIISYEPYNFKGSLDDFPLTVDYGNKMDALRDELRAFFWDGEFRYKSGVSVTTWDGEAFGTYAVYKRLRDEAIGVVICNYEDSDAVVVLSADNEQDINRYRLLGKGGWNLIVENILIPPQSAVVCLPAS